MTLSRNRLDYMAFLVYRALKEHPNVTLRSPDAAVAIARRVLAENARQERELEKEAEAMLAGHRAEILRSQGDYRRMVQEGMRMLARKRGIPL